VVELLNRLDQFFLARSNTMQGSCRGKEGTLTPARGNILIGTSGWSYDHWQGPFYPPDLPVANRLRYYAEHFSSVEINNSFYHLPEKDTLRKWRDAVPDDFVFTAKGSRYITHMKKLKDPKENLSLFLDRISVLGNKLGPILFQLPPRWRFNAQRLAAFFEVLSSEFRYTFEFRDQSWLNEQTYALLAQNAAAFCIYELDGFLSPKEITADFTYVRLHGPSGPYRGSYDSRTLSSWAEDFSTWSAQVRDVYCYFDNDEAGYAARNALQLQSLLQSEPGRR
jgi:uncharacterized protein YecE (DUF72 family)